MNKREFLSAVQETAEQWSKRDHLYPNETVNFHSGWEAAIYFLAFRLGIEIAEVTDAIWRGCQILNTDKILVGQP